MGCHILYKQLNLVASIVNADIAAAAAIVFSKLEALNDGEVLIGNGSNVATAVDTASVGDIDADTTGGLTIKAGVIVNADINASAAIAFSKMETIGAAEIIVGNGSGVPTAVAMSGGATISNAGVIALDQETVEDFSGNLVAAGGTKEGISVIYQDATGDMDFQVESLVNAKTAAYTVAADDRGKTVRYTGAGAVTLSLLAAATAGDGFYLYVRNDAADVITIDPDGAETINEVATVSLSPDQGIGIHCDGSEWYTIGDPTDPGGTLDGLSDTNISGQASGDLLIWDGDSWASTRPASRPLAPRSSSTPTSTTARPLPSPRWRRLGRPRSSSVTVLVCPPPWR
jgi:hypothetical protein